MEIRNDDIFENITRKASYIPHKREYDIKITLNKNSKQKKQPYSLRFALLNAAAVEFGNNRYIQVSKITKDSTRMYFRSFDTRKYLDVHKVCVNKSANGSYFFTITPSEELEKIMRSNWILKEFKLKYDEERGLFYIELEDK